MQENLCGIREIFTRAYDNKENSIPMGESHSNQTRHEHTKRICQEVSKTIWDKETSHLYLKSVSQRNDLKMRNWYKVKMKPSYSMSIHISEK